MSGGHFNHTQYNIEQIADDIEAIINNNDSKKIDAWGDRVGYGFSPEVIEKFREAVTHLRRAYVYAQRIDWLVSGDDGEESFHRRLANDLMEIEHALKEIP